MSALPTRRLSLEGETFEGTRLRLSFSVAKKLYRCPGCGGPISIGAGHVFVSYRDAEPPFDHEHWHHDCAHDRLVGSCAKTTAVPAHKPPRRRRGRR